MQEQLLIKYYMIKDLILLKSRIPRIPKRSCFTVFQILFKKKSDAIHTETGINYNLESEIQQYAEELFENLKKVKYIHPIRTTIGVQVQQ